MPFDPDARDKNRKAKRRFCELTGAIPGDKGLLGDLMLDGHSVAVRVADGGNINQIRAVRYQPLVVLRNDRWYVVAPDDVIEIVTRTAIGQHGWNPLENKSISSSAVSEYELLHEDQLRDRTLGAIAQGEKRPDLMRAMVTVSQSLSTLAAKSAGIVQGARRLLDNTN